MRKYRAGRIASLAVALVCLMSSILLSACGSASEFGGINLGGAQTEIAGGGFEGDGTPILSDPTFVRTPPEVLMPQLGEQQIHEVYNEHSGMIDISFLSDGYVAAQITSPQQARMRIIKGTIADLGNAALEDNYSIDNDGTVNYFPLTRGDGHYTFVLSFFAEDRDGQQMYSRLVVVEADVVLNSEFAPYIIPTRIVRYTPESELVATSHEITQNASTDLEVVQQIYAWIVENVQYDHAKVEEVRGASGYEPYPDETLQTGLGICYDFASLAAAMLRANGIPTMLVKGDVSYGDEGTVYHAWNLVWTEESGWIAAGISANANDWSRIDTTFAATGGQGMSEFVGDGENYTDLSYH